MTAPLRGLRDTAVPIFAAGAFLFWAITLVAGQLGEQHAAHDGRNVVKRTGLVVFSAARIGLSSRSPDLHFEDFGDAVRLRYRYTGLRLIVARDGRYYAVPIGWRARTDPVYVLRESDDLRVELTPGVQ
ncbi:hypothetical protein ACFYR1_51085 [Streptomyces canus]|uniref:hypothetical protein n=1 Tax=Streptomyces canus TaxID=58343 RepID=UPI0036BC040D